MKIKILSVAAALLLANVPLSAQITLWNFSNNPTLANIYSASTPSGMVWSGGVASFVSPATQADYIQIGINNTDGSTTYDGTGLTQLTLTYRIDAGNDAGGGFNIFLADNTLTQTFLVTVNTASKVIGQWYTETEILSSTGSGDPTNLIALGIAGNNTSGNFRMSFQNTATLGAVPEPSTYAAIFGLLAVGLVAYRRRVAA